MEIRIWLKERRKALGLTQAQLAVSVGYDQSKISRIENGSTRITLEILQRVTPALGSTPEAALSASRQPSAVAG